MSEIESTLEEQGPVSCRVRVQVPADRVKAAFDKAYKGLAKSARVSGFRKGKAPRSVLEESYGERVRGEVLGDLIEATCGEALEKHELRVVSSPQLMNHEMVEGSDLKFEVRVELVPQFELGDYKGREAVRKIVRIEDRHIDDAIDHVRERLAELEPEEERVNVAHGDIVVVDMAGTCDGESVEEASGEGVQVEVGAGRFPEEFEKQLVGVTRAIPTPIHVRFSDDHHSEALAGKLVRFDVTVREIKNKVLPKLDEEFPAQAGYDDCESIDELRARIRSDLEERAREDASRRMRNEVLSSFVELHGFEVPETLVDRQMGSMLRDMGMTEIPEDKFDEIRKALEPAAAKQVRAGFVLDEVAKAEGLEVDREELVSEVNRQIAMAGKDGEKVKSYYAQHTAIASLHSTVLRDKALDRLLELAVQRDEEVDEAQVADRP